jgi:hypothetical protein
MRYNKLFFAISGLMAVLGACRGKDNKAAGMKDEKATKEGTVKVADNNTANKLDGAWEIKRAEGDMAKMNEGTVYEFKGNKLTFGKDGFNNPGTTEVTDSTFSFQAHENGYKFMYNYHFSGDTMVVTMQNGTGQVFYLVKK